MKVPRRLLVGYLREAGYSFKGQTRHSEFYRRVGGTERVRMPRRKTLEHSVAVAVLRSMGMSREAAETLLEQLQENDVNAGKP